MVGKSIKGGCGSIKGRLMQKKENKGNILMKDSTFLVELIRRGYFSMICG